MGDEDRYNMSHSKRGVALVINNGTFTPDSLPNIPFCEDQGQKVKEAFEKLRFKVDLVEDATADTIRAKILAAARNKDKDVDCFACVIMTHGKEDVVCGTDGEEVDIEVLLQPFKTQGSALLGKPKLFFIQACRGKKEDDGAALGVEADGPEAKVPRIPLEADFLVAYSTVRGFESIGSLHVLPGWWFINALCSLLLEHGGKLDILTLMTRVNKKVAYGYETNHGKKQVPCITSMLTKDLYFSTNT